MLHPCVHVSDGYPLVNVYVAMGNHHFEWENQLSMVMFHSDVSLPEGIFCQYILQKVLLMPAM